MDAKTIVLIVRLVLEYGAPAVFAALDLFKKDIVTEDDVYELAKYVPSDKPFIKKGE